MGGLKMGGAWDWSAMKRCDAPTFRDSSNECATPQATAVNEWLTDVGWPTTSRVDGISLQQS